MLKLSMCAGTNSVLVPLPSTSTETLRSTKASLSETMSAPNTSLRTPRWVKS